jgi:DNA-binding MarR family transcriptional regulator
MIPYRECIVFLLAKGHQKAHRNLKKRLKPFNLTPVQALVLGALEEENGLTASEIGKRLELDNATVSGILDRLSESSWIVRTTDENDRRVQRIFLPNTTESEMVSKLYEARREANEETLSHLTQEERILFKRLLRDLV